MFVPKDCNSAAFACPGFRDGSQAQNGILNQTAFLILRMVDTDRTPALL